MEQFGAGVPGDYNFDGVVDAADYTVWRDSFGQTGTGLAADGDGDGQIDEGDYAVWKLYFGVRSDGAGGTAAVPEPVSGGLTLILLLGVVLERQILARFAAH